MTRIQEYEDTHMLRYLSSLIALLGLTACQTSSMPARSTVPAQVLLDKGPRVDEGVKAHQNQWLKGLVLDPDQTGIDTLVVLGDSWSDTGTLFLKTQTLAPPQVFWRSRFSNGPIWTDYVQGATGWTVRNYAFADIEEGQALDTIPATSVLKQIEQLKQDAKKISRASTLVSLWIGPDAYLEKADADTVPKVLKEIREALIMLDSLGFHQIAVGTLPDLSDLPLASSPAVPSLQRNFWKTVATTHNTGLNQLLEQLKKERLDLQAYPFQAYGVQALSREAAESARVVLKQGACFDGDARGMVTGERHFCRQPSSTPYWDASHPSSKLHCFFAAQFLADTAHADHVGGYNRGQAVDHCQQL
jgi:phospholipase/lecithinase/hemolysin